MEISLRKKSSIPARLASRYQSGISQDHSASTPTGASTDIIIDWIPASATHAPLLQKPSAPPPKKPRSTYTLSTHTGHATSSQSIASDDTIVDWNSPATKFRLHEDSVSPWAVTPAPASRRSTRAFRKLSGVVTPLGLSSLNPSVRVASLSKQAPQTAKQTHRRTAKQGVERASTADVLAEESQPGAIACKRCFYKR